MGDSMLKVSNFFKMIIVFSLLLNSPLGWGQGGAVVAPVASNASTAASLSSMTPEDVALKSFEENIYGLYIKIFQSIGEKGVVLNSTSVTSVQNEVTACYNSAEAEKNEFIKNGKECVARHMTASKMCIESLSPEIQAAMMIMIPMLKTMSGSSVADACKNQNDIASIAQKGLTLYQAACGGTKAYCDSACSSSLKGILSFENSFIKCTQQAILKVQSAGQADLNSIQTLVNSIRDPKIPGSVGNRAEVCGKHYGMMLAQGAIGLMQVVQQNKAAAACRDAAEQNKSPTACLTIADATEKASCIAKQCSLPQYATSNTLCCTEIEANRFVGSCLQVSCGTETFRYHESCLAMTCSNPLYKNTSGCDVCRNSASNTCGWKTTGVNTDGSNKLTTDGVKLSTGATKANSPTGGSDGPNLGGGSNGSMLTPDGAKPSGAAPPSGGGGSGLASGSGVSGSADRGVGSNSKKLSTALFGGEGGGGGGFGFGGRGTASEGGLRNYLPGGSKSAANVAGKFDYSKEITGAYGKSVWDKVKDRYNDNKSSLLPK